MQVPVDFLHWSLAFLPILIFAFLPMQLRWTAFADRDEWLTDPDFVAIPLEQIRAAIVPRWVRNSTTPTAATA